MQLEEVLNVRILLNNRDKCIQHQSHIVQPRCDQHAGAIVRTHQRPEITKPIDFVHHADILVSGLFINEPGIVVLGQYFIWNRSSLAVGRMHRRFVLGHEVKQLTPGRRAVLKPYSPYVRIMRPENVRKHSSKRKFVQIVNELVHPRPREKTPESVHYGDQPRNPTH